MVKLLPWFSLYLSLGQVGIHCISDFLFQYIKIYLMATFQYISIRFNECPFLIFQFEKHNIGRKRIGWMWSCHLVFNWQYEPNNLGQSSGWYECDRFTHWSWYCWSSCLRWEWYDHQHQRCLFGRSIQFKVRVVGLMCCTKIIDVSFVRLVIFFIYCICLPVTIKWPVTRPKVFYAFL